LAKVDGGSLRSAIGVAEIGTLCGAQASGQPYSHLPAAANEQHCDRNVSNEGKQQRRGRHAERCHQYLDCDQPAEDTPKSAQARLHDKSSNRNKNYPDLHKILWFNSAEAAQIDKPRGCAQPGISK
jgi:hypothetical protein